MTPAEVNCALCACAALCSHTFRERFTSGRTLRVMWHEIVNRRRTREFSLSAAAQAVQQHQLSFAYFLDALENESATPRPDPWTLMESPDQPGMIDRINHRQWQGIETMIRETLLWRKEDRQVTTFRGRLTGAMDYMANRGSVNWIFALLVSGEARVDANAGFANTVFGHWNFAYLEKANGGLEPRFIDYQGEDAVRSTWPVCVAAGHQLAEPGRQATLLVAVRSASWRELIPGSLLPTPPKPPEAKRRDPLTPHTEAATRAPKRAAKSPATRATRHRRDPPRKKSGGPSKPRK
jgi:hypothetical protein